MFETLLEHLPEPARACRRLYDPATGGYHLPPRPEHHHITLADVPALRARHSQVQYDCIELPVADLLSSLVINTHSRLILETGTSRGFSTSHLAAAARCVHGDAAKVITLDLAPTPEPMFAGSALATSIDNIQTDSIRYDLAGKLAGEPVDFMFLDSLHSYEHLSREIERFLPLLKVGGLLALHDTFFFDGLGLVTLMLMQFDGIEALSLPTHRRHARQVRSPGVSLFRKMLPIGDRDLRFPRGLDTLATELVHIQDPAPIAERLGLPAMRRHYQAQRLLDLEQRTGKNLALLEPATQRSPEAAALLAAAKEAVSSPVTSAADKQPQALQFFFTRAMKGAPEQGVPLC